MPEKCAGRGKSYDRDDFKGGDGVHHPGADLHAQIIERSKNKNEPYRRHLNASRVLDAGVFRKTHSENGDRAGLGNERGGPAVEKPPERAIRLAQELVVPPRT